MYREEGVSTTELIFTDNREVIECLIGRRGSVFAQLEDTCVQKGSDMKFHQAMSSQMSSHRCFSVPPGGERGLKFVITHTIADITYSAVDFTSKNMDILKAELTEVAQASSNSIVREMFGEIKVERGKLAKGQLIASKFLGQLDEMMKIIVVSDLQSFGMRQRTCVCAVVSFCGLLLKTTMISSDYGTPLHPLC